MPIFILLKGKLSFNKLTFLEIFLTFYHLLPPQHNKQLEGTRVNINKLF